MRSVKLLSGLCHVLSLNWELLYDSNSYVYSRLAFVYGLHNAFAIMNYGNMCWAMTMPILINQNVLYGRDAMWKFAYELP